MAQNVQIKIETDEGPVVIHTPVFRRLIEETVHRYSDGIRIANYKGDIPDWIQKVTGTDYIDAFDYNEENGMLAVTVRLIVREDLHFENIASGLIRSIKDTIFNQTGVAVASVDCIVTAHFTSNGIVDVKDVSYKE